MSQPSAEPSALKHGALGQCAVEHSAVELRAMQRALALAATPGVPLGPNPRVGCVLLDAAGDVVGGAEDGVGRDEAERVELFRLEHLRAQFRRRLGGSRACVSAQRRGECDG